MSENLEFQAKFVAQLKSVFPTNISIAEELSDLLEVSTDSIYRRLRCQSSFSFDEVALISQKFGVSVDGLLAQNSLQVSFNFSPMYQEPMNFENYFKFFAHYLNELASHKGTRIIYAGEDVPVFRHFKFPNISAFKSFYWSKAVLNDKNLIGKKFNPEFVSSEIIEMNKQTYNTYCRIDRTEIWSQETLTSTLIQIEFFWESGLFESREIALMVIDDIRKMMAELQDDCDYSGETKGERRGEFILYNSEVFIGNNCVLIESGESKMNDRIFLGYNTFSSISTYNAAFSKETKMWMENLMKKSLLLSGTGEKQRSKFFNKMEEYISTLEKKILSD